MARYLVETLFTYTSVTYETGMWGSGLPGKPEINQGSYLGTKPASAATLRRFVLNNARDLGIKMRIRSIAVHGASTSRWIAV